MKRILPMTRAQALLTRAQALRPYSEYHPVILILWKSPKNLARLDWYTINLQVPYLFFE